RCGHVAVWVGAGVGPGGEPAHPAGGEQPQRIPAGAAPPFGDPSPLHHDMVGALPGQAAADRQPGLAGPHDHGLHRAHGPVPPLPVPGQAAATSTLIATPWVSTSYTADRATACCTSWRSASGDASPRTRKLTRIWLKPLRTSSDRPRIPRRSMSPSTRDSTDSRLILRTAAMLPRPEVRHEASAASRSSAGVGAHQHRGVVRLDGERAVVLLLGAYAVERADLVPVVRARDPAVGHAEAEAGRLGVRLDGIERCEQLGHIDAVALGLGCDSSHCLLLLSITEWTRSASARQACAAIGQVPESHASCALFPDTGDT